MYIEPFLKKRGVEQSDVGKESYLQSQEDRAKLVSSRTIPLPPTIKTLHFCWPSETSLHLSTMCYVVMWPVELFACRMAYTNVFCAHVAAPPVRATGGIRISISDQLCWCRPTGNA